MNILNEHWTTNNGGCEIEVAGTRQGKNCLLRAENKTTERLFFKAAQVYFSIFMFKIPGLQDSRKTAEESKVTKWAQV